MPDTHLRQKRENSGITRGRSRAQMYARLEEASASRLLEVSQDYPGEGCRPHRSNVRSGDCGRRRHMLHGSEHARPSTLNSYKRWRFRGAPLSPPF